MSRARIQLAPAYLLRVAPYRDTSLLIEAWTQDHGRVGLVSRGSRGARSRTRALLQPFQPLLLSWSEQGDLGSLSSVEAAGMPVALDGEAVFSGWYLNELLLRLLQRHDPHPLLYAEYSVALGGLSASLEASLRIFEKQLLSELGYGLQLPDDLQAAGHYRYDPDDGPQPASAEWPDALTGRALIALRDEAFDGLPREQLRELQRLLRQLLRPLLGDRELQSARLLRSLRKRQG